MRVHLVGAFGAGMTALGELLSDRGWSLTGSDLQNAPERHSLNDRYVRIHQGHHAGHVPADAQLVVFSPAIPEGNPERVSARQQKIPQASYDEFLAELTKSHRAFCVAGTHGKTTTTGMLATILRESNVDASALVGGELVQYARSGWSSSVDAVGAAAAELAPPKRDSIIVLESCEYRRHFLKFQPNCAVVLNVEPDHFDCFATLADTQDAFQKFAGRVADDGLLLVNGDCPNSSHFADHTGAKVESFGFGRSNDWTVQVNRRTQPASRMAHRFEVVYRGTQFCSVSLNVPGEHNVGNALAAIALAARAGVSARDIAQGVAQFRGTRRRFELIGSRDGVTVVSDYAHHPTAIRATIQTARDAFPNRRVICLFEPHQISRTLALLTDFADSLSSADDVTLAPIFAARENGDSAAAALGQLVNEIEQRNTRVRTIASLDQAVATLDDVAKCGDVLLIMGAGNVDRVPKQFLAHFEHSISKQTT